MNFFCRKLVNLLILKQINRQVILDNCHLFPNGISATQFSFASSKTFIIFVANKNDDYERRKPKHRIQGILAR